MWTHLERASEAASVCAARVKHRSETDRRIILNRISWLKENGSATWANGKAVQRKNRGKLTRVALVGYTNAGKSTLMNVLSKRVFAEKQAFCDTHFP